VRRGGGDGANRGGGGGGDGGGESSDGSDDDAIDGSDAIEGGISKAQIDALMRGMREQLNLRQSAILELSAKRWRSMMVRMKAYLTGFLDAAAKRAMQEEAIRCHYADYLRMWPNQEGVVAECVGTMTGGRCQTLDGEPYRLPPARGWAWKSPHIPMSGSYTKCLHIDHLTEVEDTIFRWMEARYNELDEWEPAERASADWKTGLDNPLHIVHLLFGVEPLQSPSAPLHLQPEWKPAGGLVFRCGGFPGACHHRRRYRCGRIDELRETFTTAPAKKRPESEEY